MIQEQSKSLWEPAVFGKSEFLSNLQGESKEAVPPDPKEATSFWTNLGGSHTKNTERKTNAHNWLNDILKPGNIRKKDVKSIRDRWDLGYLPHVRWAENVETCVNKGEVPDRMVEGKTTLTLENDIVRNNLQRD